MPEHTHVFGFDGMRKADESDLVLVFQCPHDPEHGYVANRCQAQTKAGAQCRCVTHTDNEDMCRTHGMSERSEG